MWSVGGKGCEVVVGGVSEDVMAERTRLVVFDMEGTLADNPTVWELMHHKLGTWGSHGLPYWEEFKAGGLDYDEFARKDVATWRGASVQLLDEAIAEVPLMTGCVELFQFLAGRGIRSAIISNGLERLGLRLARELVIDRVAANREVVSDGRLTGELDLLVPFCEKGAHMLRVASEMGIRADEIMAGGDGAADVAMFQSAGRSVAFLPENDRVAEAAGHVIERADLRELEALLE